jgi:hypothetical protein
MPKSDQGCPTASYSLATRIAQLSSQGSAMVQGVFI